MVDFSKHVQEDCHALIGEWISSKHLHKGNLFVIGCSTSEIAGKHIGTAGSEELAAIVFNELEVLKNKTAIKLAFQCCEHLNRALVVEQETMDAHQLEQVSVIPVPTAGGSMASYAYKHMENPVVVETIQAHAGIDVGETMIGMHLKQVAVPVRFSQRMIGNARVTAARTRPKLIGGERAMYHDTAINNSCN
ncbi:TIGR01440 family protein [Virgibacillus oceani]|uniref:UPF0340 protein GCM10011398_35120 n=1 Tax=Virgibacillus oceani TaxID=1479511 RepID=A0A917HQB3_9BACI|nr:TIGR01440 family protein [Virgibacillus oceani]GGG86314.1 UPF0340 protein YwlG [Virgibacillus oceani]